MKRSKIVAGLIALTLVCTNTMSAFLNSGIMQASAISEIESTILKSGSFDNITWELDSEGLLKITGTGDMPNCDYYTETPWHKDSNSIKNVVIEDGVTSIGDFVFYNYKNLTLITIPDSVESIGISAFSSCSSLTEIVIPDSVTSIGEGAFVGCISLKSITIPDSVTSIGAAAFYGCTGFTSITIPDSVTSIAECAFTACSSLTEIIIPDSVASIGAGAFYWCKSLTSITIPDSVTSIDSNAFYNCTSLTSITILDSVTSIGSDAFSNCSLDLVFTVVEGSYAEQWLVNNGFSNIVFVSDTTNPDIIIWGDANCDGIVTVADVVAAAAVASAQNDLTLSEQGIANADVHMNGDGISAADASIIQEIALELYDGKTLPVSYK